MNLLLRLRILIKPFPVVGWWLLFSSVALRVILVRFLDMGWLVLDLILEGRSLVRVDRDRNVGNHHLSLWED